ncbi:MAG TPA: universal stress protein [Metalysinibacillus jejuensis]|uniref:Universal stress protein n=1 Tax=Metalysinibacillus jejuensis TaxID=914327 RepID=A0A921T448_9BACL|nr:universal stress protein [Metalysinibacillus jejuensis]HJH10580.1 universal stress protein [Metalysinibacillus jejuensis]
MQSYHKIIVAVDGSSAADRALDKAVAIAKRNDAALHIVHAIDTKQNAAIELYLQNIQEKALLVLADYKMKAVNEGLSNVTVALEYGAPKHCIPKKVALTFEADLIICGATGMNAVERLWFGSVSEAIVRYAPCDVLIVRN